MSDDPFFLPSTADLSSTPTEEIMPQNGRKKAGRQPKYQTPEARLRAKYDQTNASRKATRQRHRQEHQAQRRAVRTNYSGDPEWYTPAYVVEPVRQVLGTIDVDPASSDIAQRTVQATRFYTAQDNALLQAWHGRVFLNPPFLQPLVAHFVTRLVAEYRAGHVSEAILLTHNFTETAWFQRAEAAATRMCFTTKRIKFVDPHGNRMRPTQGNVFFYFGPNVETFTRIFRTFGRIHTPETEA
jgi:hypothetical protein